MKDADDLFVVSELFPKSDVSHSAIEVGKDENPCVAFRAARAAAADYGVKLGFRKLLRRSDLLPWAETNHAKLLVSL